MEVLSKEEIKFLINLGFNACAQGKVLYGRDIFENLLRFDENLQGAKIGLAFSHIVVDSFVIADSLLNELLSKEEHNYDACAFMALSKALQKDEQAKDYINMVPESEPCYALCQNALQILEG